MSEPGLSAAARPATAPRELTLRATLLASVLTIVFGVAAGYLGLKVGTTFSASIPAAVMSLAILRGLFRDSTILESNMVQTQASAGESLMGGVVYIVPALIFVDLHPPVLAIALLTAAGGLLGVFLLVPLRRYFIVSQHGVLPYPEGTACAEILKLGEKSAGHARRVFQGMGVGAVFNLVTAEGLGLFSGQVALTFPRVLGATVGMHLTPLMLGIGFLSGFGVGVTMFAGALLKGLIVIPGCNLASWLQQGHTLSPEELEFQVRMIGVGAVATGGFLAIFKMAPELRRSLAGGLGALGAVASRASVPRTERSLSATTVVTGVAAALGLSVWSLGLLGATNGGGALLAVVLILVLGLPFVALSARLVGIVGTSNYPLSGMTIGALLVAVLVLRLAGFRGAVGMATAIVIGTVVCLSIAISADLSQDLKTGALVGATPRLQQIGEGVAVLLTASIAGVVVMLFQQTGQLATSPAPQARLMAAIVQGVMAGDFQWGLVALGAAVAAAAEFLGVSAIMLAVGLYLPVPLASAFVVGGLLRRRFAVRHASSGEREFLEREGTLLASGLIAGWAVMGVLFVGMVALREVGFLGSVPIGTAQQPEPGLTLSYGRDLISSLIPYMGTIYYFGRVIRLWGPATAR